MRYLKPVVLAALAAQSAAANAQTLASEIVASGLNRPVFVTHAPADFDRIFILEKAGVIRVHSLASGTLLATPFLDINSLVGGGTSDNDERGLLGLVFHPDYESNGRFYVNYTNNSNDTVVAEYTALGDPATTNLADASSARQILAIAQPQVNHNGGWLGFGPNDGYLYISSGDGGGGGDTGPGHNTSIGNGQSLVTLLGKLLRIDIDSDDFPADSSRNYAIPPSNPFTAPLAALDEIWAYGLRNPWRPSFDRATGDLYIADVGQNAWEEINFQPASSAGGENYGWRCREGAHDFNTTNCTGSHTEPIHDYTHTGHTCASITGGYVYRGCALPDHVGSYFFADYCFGHLTSLTTDGVLLTSLVDHTSEIGLPSFQITSFGEDAAGELYYCLQGSGRVRKIVPADPVDTNNNGVLDSCEPSPCPADLNNDGFVDSGDISAFVTFFLAADPAADLNNDGFIDSGDISAFVTLFLDGC